MCAPQAHQIERGTAGNRGESSQAQADSACAVRPDHRPNHPQVIAASQAESSGVGCRQLMRGPRAPGRQFVPSGYAHGLSVEDEHDVTGEEPGLSGFLPL
jgi:hypothetical protein